jgi:hypothetical protein
MLWNGMANARRAIPAARAESTGEGYANRVNWSSGMTNCADPGPCLTEAGDVRQRCFLSPVHGGRTTGALVLVIVA